ncbi:hypothetical protein HBH56_208290 [Parastagonospora nodorum]|uniref:Uncharacterized protein n=1 Tax=Phaeosphaeria nodorum (strain SN15 / ATCC MYA-4574 / FGSC 10173) TaxID=321614 RepID=A0A7U2I2R9_PHANO|nr:hypothetical protein HBH56_208290 [Parastagonospora nodorum]QRC99613.1 hypothetical protein JI435_413660 [Parastagonospora nodorum SN15]KAH3923650.1 hypothetical protein HBH54_207160 [Parastagonospora nodorum]KAH4129212.1 hypothetical protein HBH45_208440 [Parastagonospora nodorum]KAH4149427.1 hypothetical protein HBH44_194500 [Parastagonospora nodorum]
MFPAAFKHITSDIPYPSRAPTYPISPRRPDPLPPTTPISTHSFQRIQPRIHLQASPPPTHPSISSALHTKISPTHTPMRHRIAAIGSRLRATSTTWVSVAHISHPPSHPISHRILRLAVVSTQIRPVRIYLHGASQQRN